MSADAQAQAVQAAQTPQGAARSGILVIDDNRTNRAVARLMLARLGFDAIEMEGGQAALDAAAGGALNGRRLQGVLLDLRMPGLSGEQTCVALRQIELTRRLRIVACTSHASDEDRPRLLRLGFDDLLLKPVDVQALQRAFASAG